MKNLNKAVKASLLTIGLFFPVLGQQKIITGKVVDSLSGEGISRAMILLYATTLSIDPKILANLKYDTVFTESDGSILHTMNVDPASYFLVYGILKQGYRIKYSFAGMPYDAVSLGTIQLTKVGNPVNDVFTVRGTIVDSITGKGVGGAQVIMSGLGSFDTAGNTAITGNDGKFSKPVTAGNAANDRQLVYMISRNDYRPMVGQQAISDTVLDLGTILLKRTSPGFIAAARPVTFLKSTVFMELYTLQGQVLCKGSALSGDKRLRLHNGVAIAAYRNQNGDVKAAKIVEAK